MKQIDFSELFFDSLGDRKHVSYELRFRGPNLLHDLAFMNGLLHDSMFKLADFNLNRTRLAIDLDRDRWETYRRTKTSLEAIRSVLSIHGVQSVEWRTESPMTTDEETWMIDHLYIPDEYRQHDLDKFPLYIVGHRWKLKIVLAEDTAKVKLRDYGDTK